MEANLSIYLPDDTSYEMYDDEFSVSLFRIVENLKNKNPAELGKMLDGNGYFGRYDMRQIGKYGRMTGTMKMKIYLPDSKLHYYWPFKTLLNLNDFDNLRRIQNELPPNSFELIKNAYQYNPEFKSNHNLFMTSRFRKKYIKLLNDYPVIRDKIPIIKTKLEALEIASNIVKI